MSTASARVFASAAALGLALAACSTGYQAAVPLVRVHAASDLDCPDGDIRIEEEIGGRFQAAGCGRKARYRAACEGVSCVVSGEDDPTVPWHDRPEPGDPTWH
jgi:hypothetical protein